MPAEERSCCNLESEFEPDAGAETLSIASTHRQMVQDTE